MVTQAKEKGASSWLTVLPIEENEFTLTKNEFRDSIHLRYSKTLKGMPSLCPCGQKRHNSWNELQKRRLHNNET